MSTKKTMLDITLDANEKYIKDITEDQRRTATRLCNSDDKIASLINLGVSKESAVIIAAAMVGEYNAGAVDCVNAMTLKALENNAIDVINKINGDEKFI